MTAWTPYLWKELRQSRRLGLAAVGLFLGIGLVPPILDHIHQGSRRYDDDALLMIIELGGPILAVVAGVYAMGREQGAIEQFWRSRPIHLTRWLVSKYATGLAIVWLACWIPLLIWVTLIKAVSTAEISVSGNVSMVLVYSFILLLIYSASFVLGQFIRGTLHAAILSVGAMALILIMPLVVRPLNWLSVDVLRSADVGALSTSSCVALVAGMTLLSIALLWLSWVLLKRGLQVDADQRTLSWSVVAILLVLTAGVAFPMGTNLPVKQVIPLPVGQNGMVYGIATHGNEMLILFSGDLQRGKSRGRPLGLVRVHIGEQASTIDEPLWFADSGQEQNVYYDAYDLAWPAEHPSVAYVTVRRTVKRDGTANERVNSLYTIALDARKNDSAVIHRVDLNPLLGTGDGRPSTCLHQGRLYVYSDFPPVTLLTFSLDDPEAPSWIRSEDLEQRIGYAGPRMFRGPTEQPELRLVPLADLNELARLEVTRRLDSDSRWALAGKGRILAHAYDRSAAMQLVVFEMGPAENSVIPLRPQAYRRAGAVERFLRLSYGGMLYGSGPLVYRLSGALGVTVYDVSRTGRIERVGHYAGDGFSAITLLPNDRVAVAGKKLHVLDLSGKVPH